MEMKKTVIKPQVATNNNAVAKSPIYENKYLIVVLLVALTSIFYSNSLNNDLLNWDDDGYVTRNEDIRSFSAENIKKWFSESYIGIYVPITMVTYAIDYQIWELNPFGYHFGNLFYHILNTLLVFYLFTLIFKKASWAGLAALLFALHPMHVESVAWVSERKDLIFALFFLLSLCVYIKYIEKEKWWLYGASFILFVLSCFSKTTGITLALVICFFDFWYKRKLSLKLILEKLPFFAVLIAFCFVSMRTQSDAMAIGNFQVGIIERVTVVAYSGIYYILKFFVPTHLCFIHPFPLTKTQVIDMPSYYYASYIIYIAILAWLIFDKKQRQNIILSFGFYFATICLTINIVPIGMCIVAERYSYIPYIGLTMMLLFVFQNIKSNGLRKGIALVFLAVCLFFGMQTSERCKDWKTTKSIARDGIKKYPYHFFPYDKLGDEFAKNGAGSEAEIKEAYGYLNKSLEYYPANERTYDNRGKIRGMIGDYNGSIEDFNNALSLYRSKNKIDHDIFAKLFFNRALSKKFIGDYAGSMADLDSSMRYENKKTRECQTLMIECSFHNKEYKRCVDLCDKLLQDTLLSNTYFFKANALFYLGQMGEAINNYTMAIELDDTNNEYFTNRGLVRKYSGRQKEACADFQRAYELGNTSIASELASCK